MNAAPADQLRLLDLAALDARSAQLEEARRNPPQAARVKELIELRQTQSQELRVRQNVVDELRAELSRIEADVAVVDARQKRDDTLLHAATSTKDVAGIERELESLARRRNDLEDTQLEVMEKLETAVAEAEEQEALLTATGQEGASLSSEAKAVVGEATAELEQTQRDRAAVAGSVAADLLALYEKLRTRSNGAALLRARTCTGCHMLLSGSDLVELRQTPADAVATCPECGCILVRDGESGL